MCIINPFSKEVRAAASGELYTFHKCSKHLTGWVFEKYLSFRKSTGRRHHIFHPITGLSCIPFWRSFRIKLKNKLSHSLGKKYGNIHGLKTVLDSPPNLSTLCDFLTERFWGKPWSPRTFSTAFSHTLENIHESRKQVKNLSHDLRMF